MAYVTVDEAGKLTGLFANPQPDVPGFQEIADDDPRIEPFLAETSKRPLVHG